MFKNRRSAVIMPESGRQCEAVPIPAPSGTIIVGESFEYRVHWLGIDVGNAALTVAEKTFLDGREVFHIIMTARTNKFFSFFYRVEGTVESYLDAVTFEPLRHDSTTILGKKKVFKKMKYDILKGVVYAEDKKGSYEVAVPADVLDPLGVFYYFRIRPVFLDTPVNLTINGGKKNFPVTVFVNGPHQILTPAGRFMAFQVKPTTQSEREFDDALNAPGSMILWFSADEKRIPLLITLKVPLGIAQAILESVKEPVAVQLLPAEEEPPLSPAPEQPQPVVQELPVVPEPPG